MLLKNLVFGSKVVQHLLNKHPQRIQKICLKPHHRLLPAIKKQRIKYDFWNPKQFDALVGDYNHQFIIAYTTPHQYYPLNQLFHDLRDHGQNNHLILILDHLKDPYNFGTILRTAKAVGVDAVVIANFNQVQINAVVAKSSMGALFDLKIVLVANLDQVVTKLKKASFWIVSSLVTPPKQQAPPNLINTNVALIVGSEAAGISSILAKKSDFYYHLPMKNQSDSLNVSNATAVLLYKIRSEQNFW